VTAALPSLAKLKPNPNWAKLPLFNRKNWSRVRFGDVVENLNETCDPAEAGLERVIAMEHLEPGSLHIRSWGNVADGTTFTRRCRPGQVLFGKRRAYQRKVAVAEFDAVVSGDIYVLAPKGDRLLPELLPFLCLSERFFQHAVGTSAGSLSPRTNWSSLASFEFDLPPLDQQRRIAEILSAVDEEGQEWLKTKSAAEQAYDTFVEHSLAEFEGKSRQVRLGDMIQEGRPLCYGIVQPGEVSSDGTPFIRVCDMEGGNVNVAGLMRVSDSVNRQYRRSTVASGDILVSIVGTIGRVVIVSPECEGFNIARAVARIAPSQDLHSDFLAFLLRATSTQRRLVGSSFESARKTLNLSALEVLEFPLPDKKQQSTFMSELNVLHEALTALNAKLEASKKLQMTITNQLFS
jgi:type I restriction enzyme S subunit